MSSEKEKEAGAVTPVTKSVSFCFSDTEIDKQNAWVDYDKCSLRAVEALEKNQRMRKHFSVIEVTDDDPESSKRPRSTTFFNFSKHHCGRKSIELKVIETEAEVKPKAPMDFHRSMDNGIWGSQSRTVDSKNLHPEVAELLEAAALGDNVKLKKILEDQNSSRGSALLNFNAIDPIGRCALHFAVYNRHFESANLLINQGVVVDVWDREKKATPLICAAAIGEVALVDLLLLNGANVNNGFDRGNTALVWAAKSGNLECLKKILEAGAKQNTPQMLSETALHVAASNGDYNALKLLLENGADVSLRKGEERNSALHLAAQECVTSCCRLLLDNKADIDAQNAKGETALHISALKDVDTLQFLLDQGASVKLKDVEGRTALFYAIEKVGRNPYAPECVALLIKHDADINCQDNLGLCPLHIAALKEATECAALLIKNNANVTLVSKARTSALSMMLRKIPDTMHFIRTHLNESVIVMRDTNDSSCKVKLDFKTLAPNGSFFPIHPTNQSKGRNRIPANKVAGKESELITCILSTGLQRDILLHPLVEAFLTLKWQKVRKFFYAGILLKIVLVLLFSYFMVALYAGGCVDKALFKDGNSTTTYGFNETYVSGNISESKANLATRMDAKELAADIPDKPIYKECFPRPLWISLWSLIVCFASILIVQEITQLFQSFKSYIKYIESWVFWTFITSLCITCTFLPKDGENFKKEIWQQSFAAVSVFLAWIFVLLQLGKFPSSGTLVQMFFKVFYNFAQCFVAYFCIIMAFALAFCILFPLQNAFRNPLLAFTKIIRMMSGDVNPEDLIFKKEIKPEDKTMFETPFPWVTLALHTVFIIMVTIVLMNLLVGLAVADIQGMYRDARLLRLARQAALIYHVESSFLSPAVLNWLPNGVALAIKRNILILPYLRNGFFYFKPYDHRDCKLPDYIQKSALKMINTTGMDKRNSTEELDRQNDATNLKEMQLKLDVTQKQLDRIMEKLDSLASAKH